MTTDVKAMMISIPCPNCEQLSQEPIARIVENDVIPCSLCMGLIDLTAEECRPIIEDARRLWQPKSG